MLQNLQIGVGQEEGLLGLGRALPQRHGRLQSVSCGLGAIRQSVEAGLETTNIESAVVGAG
jgi:hypothetical protein